MVRLSSRSDRSRSVEDIIASLRERIEEKYPEIRIEFVQVLQDVLNDLAGNPRPIEVKLFGPDYAKLHEIADSLAEKIQKLPGLVDLYDGHERDAPNLRFAMRRDEIARLQTNPDEVTAQLEASLAGVQVGSFRKLDRLIGVRVRYPNTVRFDAPHVLDLPFLAKDRVSTLSAVTTPEFTTSPSLLMHEALQPMVDVTADHEHRDLGSTADDVEALVTKTALPPNVSSRLGASLTMG
jgi:Cu/Ag efflux pump CusA